MASIPMSQAIEQSKRLQEHLGIVSASSSRTSWPRPHLAVSNQSNIKHSGADPAAEITTPHLGRSSPKTSEVAFQGLHKNESKRLREVMELAFNRPLTLLNEQSTFDVEYRLILRNIGRKSIEIAYDRGISYHCPYPTAALVIHGIDGRVQEWNEYEGKYLESGFANAELVSRRNIVFSGSTRLRQGNNGYKSLYLDVTPAVYRYVDPPYE